MMEQEIFEFIGKSFAFTASSAAIAFLLMKVWGQKWIENKFTKDLELFKAQKLHDFGILLTRKTKWHEKEHEVLSEAWKKLIKSHTSLKMAISAFRSFPDLNKCSDQELKRFMADNEFSDGEKEFMKDNSEDYVFAFSKILDHRALSESNIAFGEFHAYFDENRIFLRPHIKEKFQTVADHIWSAWVSQKMELRGTRSQRDFGLEAFDKEDKEIKPLIADIESIIQNELFPEEYNQSEEK